MSLGREHQWTALATAFFTQDQAERWVDVSGLAGGEGLALHILKVICIVCGENCLDEAESCPGTPETEHRWISTLTLEMDNVEVAHWLGDEGMEPRLLPRSNSLTCAICGQTFEGASSQCPERVLYAKGGSDERHQV